MARRDNSHDEQTRKQSALAWHGQDTRGEGEVTEETPTNEAIRAYDGLGRCVQVTRKEGRSKPTRLNSQAGQAQAQAPAQRGHSPQSVTVQHGGTGEGNSSDTQLTQATVPELQETARYAAAAARYLIRAGPGRGEREVLMAGCHPSIGDCDSAVCSFNSGRPRYLFIDPMNPARQPETSRRVGELIRRLAGCPRSRSWVMGSVAE